MQKQQMHSLTTIDSNAVKNLGSPIELRQGNSPNEQKPFILQQNGNVNAIL